MTKQINRREFIRTTAATGAAFTMMPKSLTAGETAAAQPDDQAYVVDVSAPGLMKDGKKPDKPRLRKMVEAGILELTGQSDLASAWSCIVKPDDVVGIKVNNSGSPVIGTKPEIFQTVIDGVKAAGVPEKNIIVWDQVEEYLVQYYLKKAGIKPGKDGSEVQYMGCTPALKVENYEGGKPLPGFDTDPVKFPWGEVKVAELVAKKLTAIINIPILRDHSCAGVTLALKNISHAVVDIPWHCHDNCCDPHIADIVNIPAVRDKLRLHILDATLGQADGAPRAFSWDKTFTPEKLLLSADPVAVDTIGCEWIVEARKKMGYPLLKEADNSVPGVKGREPKHLATAAARGLGINDRDRIEIQSIEVPPLESKETKEG